MTTIMEVRFPSSALRAAAEVAAAHGYSSLAVIAAVGTRCYYERRGFERGALYHVMRLD